MSEENMNFNSDIIASWVIRLHDDIQTNKINRNTEAALFYLLEYIFGHAATEIMTPGTMSARLFGEGASDNAECCIFIRSNMKTINRWLHEDRYKKSKNRMGSIYGSAVYTDINFNKDEEKHWLSDANNSED